MLVLSVLLHSPFPIHLYSLVSLIFPTYPSVPLPPIIPAPLTPPLFLAPISTFPVCITSNIPAVPFTLYPLHCLLSSPCYYSLIFLLPPTFHLFSPFLHHLLFLPIVSLFPLPSSFFLYTLLATSHLVQSLFFYSPCFHFPSALPASSYVPASMIPSPTPCSSPLPAFTFPSSALLVGLGFDRTSVNQTYYYGCLDVSFRLHTMACIKMQERLDISASFNGLTLHALAH